MIKTEFNYGQKIFAVRGENIFQLTVTDVEIETFINKEGATTDVTYHTEEKIKKGLLVTETIRDEFTEGYKNIFATKEQALAYIEKVKDAREVLSPNNINLFGVNINTETVARYNNWLG